MLTPKSVFLNGVRRPVADASGPVDGFGTNVPFAGAPGTLGFSCGMGLASSGGHVHRAKFDQVSGMRNPSVPSMAYCLRGH